MAKSNSKGADEKKGKEKKDKKEKKEKKEKGLRPPKTSMQPPRGVSVDLEIKPPQQISPEEALKKFGPCHVEAQQAKTAILLLPSPETHVILVPVPPLL